MKSTPRQVTSVRIPDNLKAPAKQIARLEHKNNLSAYLVSLIVVDLKKRGRKC